MLAEIPAPGSKERATAMEGAPGPALAPKCTAGLDGTVSCGLSCMPGTKFPKDMPTALFKKGKRHDWVNVVVWIDNPAAEAPKMIGVSPSSYVSTYSKYTPPPPDGLNGMSVMINYLTDANNDGFHTVDTTWKTGGEFQDLIMWEQLTDEARAALNGTDFGEHAKVPFIDANFEANLKLAWPY
ncbi:unnamed protein product [Phytophthora lilii]|uniref:Unnamed protein product n=1 Tax=Phytophthora lilii TaxID=2077276 RepID=A0A9W6UAL4_9STRA|nr:unnamed protein product [Phytophthora lilii]